MELARVRRASEAGLLRFIPRLDIGLVYSAAQPRFKHSFLARQRHRPELFLNRAYGAHLYQGRVFFLSWVLGDK